MFHEDEPSSRLYLTLAVGALLAGLVAGALLLSACSGAQQGPYPRPTWLPTRIPWPVVTRTAKPVASPTASPTLTPLVPEPSPVATRTRTPSPVPSSTATATRTAPVPVLSPTQPPAATPFQTTGGRAVFELDLTGLVLKPGLDTYAFATGCMVAPKPPLAPDTACFQLALRGTTMPPCDAEPCGSSMAVEVRGGSNNKYDGQDMDPDTPGRQYRPEAEMCGQGTRPNRWLALGQGPVYTVTVEWGNAFGPGLHISTAADSDKLLQGVKQPNGLRSPAFGWVTMGIPCAPTGKPCGIGWSYNTDWTLQAHGGKARLIRWESVEPLGVARGCP